MLEDVTIVFLGSDDGGPPEMPPLQLENFILGQSQGSSGARPQNKENPSPDPYINKINLKKLPSLSKCLTPIFKTDKLSEPQHRKE